MSIEISDYMEYDCSVEESSRDYLSFKGSVLVTDNSCGTILNNVAFGIIPKESVDAVIGALTRYKKKKIKEQQKRKKQLSSKRIIKFDFANNILKSIKPCQNVAPVERGLLKLKQCGI